MAQDPSTSLSPPPSPCTVLHRFSSVAQCMRSRYRNGFTTGFCCATCLASPATRMAYASAMPTSSLAHRPLPPPARLARQRRRRRRVGEWSPCSGKKHRHRASGPSPGHGQVESGRGRQAGLRERLGGSRACKGQQGVQGAAGRARGSRACKGQQGVQGAAGRARGGRACKGQQGVQGAAGRARGSRACKGRQGVQGAAGRARGGRACKGQQGVQGAAGRARGSRACKGQQGVQGAAGRARGGRACKGRQGVQGAAGRARGGRACKGRQGVQGAAGATFKAVGVGGDVVDGHEALRHLAHEERAAHIPHVWGEGGGEECCLPASPWGEMCGGLDAQPPTTSCNPSHFSPSFHPLKPCMHGEQGEQVGAPGRKPPSMMQRLAAAVGSRRASASHCMATACAPAEHPATTTRCAPCIPLATRMSAPREGGRWEGGGSKGVGEE
ncbi:unnamed protein product [Closterium sp. Naga37s-1]|nr:unnamed protein product [Closterium sp. Naga37s-1]